MGMVSGGLPVVRVSFNRFARLDGEGTHGYAFRWPFDRPAEIGDVVFTSEGVEATVIGFGTDWRGRLDVLSTLTPLNRVRSGW